MFKNWHQSLREKTLHFQWLLFLLLKWLRGLEGKHVIINIYDLKLRTCFLAWRGDEMVILTHSCWKQWMRYRGGADVDGSSRPWRKLYSERHAIAFPRSSFTIICTIVEYSLPVSWSQSFLVQFQASTQSSFFARALVGVMSVQNLPKADVDVNEMSLLNI